VVDVKMTVARLANGTFAVPSLTLVTTVSFLIFEHQGCPEIERGPRSQKSDRPSGTPDSTATIR
jgi:hypothetical protein